MASTDKLLYDKLKSFSLIDKEINQTMKVPPSGVYHKKNAKIIHNKKNSINSDYEQEESVHYRLYNDGKRLSQQKQEIINNQQKIYQRKHFNPLISPFAQKMNPKIANVYKRLSDKLECSRGHTDSTRNSTNTTGKFKHMINVSSSFQGSLDKNNNNYNSISPTANTQNNKNLKDKIENNNKNTKCSCEFKYSTHFSFEPLITNKTKKLAKKLGSSKERILSKKKKYDGSVSVYFSPNRNSPYFFDDSLIEQDKENDVSKFVELYKKGIDSRKALEESIELDRKKRKNIPTKDSKNCLNNSNNVNSSKSTYNSSYTTNSSSKKFISFLNHSRDFQSKKQRNLLKLQKKVDKEEKEYLTFSPHINKGIKKDDLHSIHKQIPFINDYVTSRRSFLQKSKEGEELELNKSLSKINTSKRKFIIESSKTIDDNNNKSLKNLKYFRKKNSIEIKNSRELLQIEDFYEDNSIGLHTHLKLPKKSNYDCEKISLDEFKSAIKNISGYY